MKTPLCSQRAETSNADAGDAIAVYAEALEKAGRSLPPPRTLASLKKPPEFVAEARGNMVALISLPEAVSTAAE